MTNYLIPITSYIIVMMCFFIRGVYVPKNRKFIIAPDNSEWFLFASVIMFLILSWGSFFYFIIYLLNKLI